MVMVAVCQSLWHAVGEWIGTLSTYFSLSCSRATVRLGSGYPDVPPAIGFNWLDDKRNHRRLAGAFRRMAWMFGTEPDSRFALGPFPSSASNGWQPSAGRYRRNPSMGHDGPPQLSDADRPAADREDCQ